GWSCASGSASRTASAGWTVHSRSSTRPSTPRPRKPPTPTRTARPPVERARGAWLLVGGSRPGCLADFGLAVGSHQVPLAVLVADVHAVGAACTHVARVSVQGFATVGDLDGSVAAVDGPQHCRVDSVAGARRHFGREGRWPGFDAMVDAAAAEIG